MVAKTDISNRGFGNGVATMLRHCLVTAPVGWIIGAGTGAYFAGRLVYDIFW